MNLRVLSLLVLALSLWSASVQGDFGATFPVLAAKGERVVWLEREQPLAARGAGLNLAAAVEAQLSSPNAAERDLGLVSLFPGETVLEEIAVVDGRAMIVLTLPEPLANAFEREVISHLLGYWNESLPEIDRVSLLAKVVGEEDGTLFEGYVAPPPSKPEAKVSSSDDDDGSIEPLGVPHAPVQGTAQPGGALSDTSIFLSPGHGWEYSTDANRWATQRGNTHQYIEDHGNGESVLQYLHHYLWNAGARTYTTRERDLNTNMVIVTTSDSGYEETGSWQTEAAGGSYDGTQRLATTVTGSPTARATFTPDIPEAGQYAVYVWYRRVNSGTTSTDARITINHTGDSTLWVQNLDRDGFTWKYIGTYYFDEGSNPGTGSVVVDNQSSIAGRKVVAGAVRFGGGMGDVSNTVTGTVSGKPRWEEGARYYSAFMGVSGWESGSPASQPPNFAAWEHESWEQGKSVYISWHTNAFNGSVRGTESYSHTNPYPRSPQLRNYVHAQMIRDFAAAWDPAWVNVPSRDRGTKTASFAELTSSNPMPSTLIEIAFHDSPEDVKYLLDPQFRRDAARAVYKGIVQFYYNEMPGYNNSTYLPEPPRNLRSEANAAGTVTLEWDAPEFSTGMTGLYGHAATGYRVYQSKNGHGFDNGFSVSGTTATLDNLEPGEVVYFRVSATNAGGESFPTATLAARPTDNGASRLLIVNGFDRSDRFMNVVENDPHSANPLQRGYLDRLNTYNYVIPHAKAVEAYPEMVGFDSAEAAAIEGHQVLLGGYDAVIWMSGLQAHVNDIGTRDFSAFPGSLLSRINHYLNGNSGRLFVSGAEIAWDSDRRGVNSWLESVLKSEFVERSAQTHSARGLSASIMTDWTAQFDDGNGPVYRVDFPDTIAPVNGATSAMEYTGGSDNTVDGFESIGSWQQPGYSGQTNADPSSSFGIVSSPVHHGGGTGHLHYVWGDGDFIREYNAAQPKFSANSDFSIWVHGDGSGHRLRIAARDSDNEIYVNDYTTIDFTGWREIVWEDVRNNANFWAVDGDGVVTGPDVSLDSIQISRTAGAPSSGDFYFDYAVAVPREEAEDGSKIAAIQYDGSQSDGDPRLVYLAFPFESITSEIKQADLMTRTLDFFGFSLAPFDAWKEEHFTESELNDPDISGDFADASGDGVPNILKYALNLDPREATRSGLPEVSMEEEGLTFRFNQAKQAADIDFQVEVSGDLVSWVSGDDEVEIVSTVDEGETWRVTVRDKASFSERRFIRLEVTRSDGL